MVSKNSGGTSATSGTAKPTPPAVHRQLHDLDLDPSYPTTSLNFLRLLRAGSKTNSDVATPPEQARLRLNIIAVGAGLGGLATAVALARRGHSVLVLEQAAQLGEVGAGIQIPPNSGRLLRRWGVSKYLEESAVQPKSINFRRWQDGSVIGHTDLGDEFKALYEEPYQVVHRAHFHDALHKRAIDLGVRLRLSSKVTGYDADAATVVLEDGTVLHADLIIAADGTSLSSIRAADNLTRKIHDVCRNKY